MLSADLKFTQGIHGFQVISRKRRKSEEISEIHIRRASFQCPFCDSHDVSAYPQNERVVRAVPIGRTACLLHVTVHKLYCPDCGRTSYERLGFLPSPKSRMTRQLERTLLELRPHLSIKALSEHFGVPWQAIKDAEKAALGRKYARVSLKDVRALGIDEIYVFRTAKSHEKYITVVRDLDTGAVLEVSRGKGADALKAFSKRIRRHRKRIKFVCMDMSNAYAAWVKDALPDVAIVYDHFHVVKSMNDKLDQIRRKAMRSMDEQTRKAIKRKRFLFLKNHDKLDEDEADALEKARSMHQPLSDAYMLKEELRSIYANAGSEEAARHLFERWCRLADDTGLPEMRSMAKQVREHIKGILLLDVRRSEQRLHRGLQQQDPLADLPGLRIPRLRILQAEGLRPALNEHQEMPLKFPQTVEEPKKRLVSIPEQGASHP